jgi:phosphohistidine phosphatase
MQLYILRHGEAERISTSDRQRQLTNRGKAEVKAVVERHAQALANVDAIFASPFDRAQQTAAVVAEVLAHVTVQTLSIITPNNTSNDVLAFLCKQDSAGTLLLVSHQPLVSELVSELCDLPTHSVSMPTAALASIVLEPVGLGMGQLQFID